MTSPDKKLRNSFEINKFNLKFLDPHIEQVFKREYFAKSIKELRFSIIFVTLLYAGFGWIDFISAIEYFQEFFFIRFYIILPLFSLVYLLSYTKIYSVIWQHLLAFTYFVAGAGIIYMLHRNPENIYYYGGMFLVFISGYFFVKLHFFLATLSGVLLIITYNFSGLFFSSAFDAQFENILSTNAFFISANLISAFALYNIERLERIDFGQKHLLAIKQKEINQINQGLELKIKERTKLLDERNRKLIKEIERRKKTQKKLIHAKEKAEESDRLKSAFLANMSHEIRTPMNGILGFIGLLQDPEISKIQHDEFISLVEKSSVRLLNTINDIIEISKIEANQLVVNNSKVSINELCVNLFDFFEHEASSKGIKLIFERGQNNLTVKTDETKLESILTNLIKNAIKFTHKGEICFGYHLNDGVIEFYVRDTGIGIPEEKRESVFNRFEQVNSGEARLYEGSGLGLSIAKAYVEMLGGTIWLESQENVGSTFFFTIKGKKSKKIPAQNINEESASITQKVLKGNILVVEDDEISSTLIEKILASHDCKLYRASNGQQALDILQQNADVDLVLMDIKMPVLDGLKTVKIIRGFDQQIPVVAQTSYAMEGDREKAISAGFTDYLTKPIVSAKLVEMLMKYL